MASAFVVMDFEFDVFVHVVWVVGGLLLACCWDVWICF